jgi:hypothetical protein
MYPERQDIIFLAGHVRRHSACTNKHGFKISMIKVSILCRMRCMQICRLRETISEKATGCHYSTRSFPCQGRHRLTIRPGVLILNYPLSEYTHFKIFEPCFQITTREFATYYQKLLFRSCHSLSNTVVHHQTLPSIIKNCHLLSKTAVHYQKLPRALAVTRALARGSRLVNIICN